MRFNPFELMIAIVVGLGFAILLSQAVFWYLLIISIALTVVAFTVFPITQNVILYFWIATIITGIIGYGLGSTPFGVAEQSIANSFLKFVNNSTLTG
jgi:Na+/glutamate symporter